MRLTTRFAFRSDFERSGGRFSPVCFLIRFVCGIDDVGVGVLTNDRNDQRLGGRVLVLALIVYPKSIRIRSLYISRVKCATFYENFVVDLRPKGTWRSTDVASHDCDRDERH